MSDTKARRRQLYRERVDAGQCGMCGAPATEGPRGGRTKCDDCRATHAIVQAGRRPVLRASKKRWAAANMDKVRAYDNNIRRFADHGISAEIYYEMFARQQGRCAICDGPFTAQGPHIDHDHATGVVRGLLCAPCNLGLGVFRDDPDRLRRAADYVERG